MIEWRQQDKLGSVPRHVAKPLRVLHGPWMVGGNPAGLAAAERELGLDSTTLCSAGRLPRTGIRSTRSSGDARGRPDIVCELTRWRLRPRVLRDFE